MPEQSSRSARHQSILNFVRNSFVSQNSQSESKSSRTLYDPDKDKVQESKGTKSFAKDKSSKFESKLQEKKPNKKANRNEKKGGFKFDRQGKDKHGDDDQDYDDDAEVEADAAIPALNAVEFPALPVTGKERAGEEETEVSSLTVHPTEPNQASVWNSLKSDFKGSESTKDVFSSPDKTIDIFHQHITPLKKDIDDLHGQKKEEDLFFEEFEDEVVYRPAFARIPTHSPQPLSLGLQPKSDLSDLLGATAAPPGLQGLMDPFPVERPQEVVTNDIFASLGISKSKSQTQLNETSNKSNDFWERLGVPSTDAVSITMLSSLSSVDSLRPFSHYSHQYSLSLMLLIGSVLIGILQVSSPLLHLY
jgi:hypothetical protein